MGIVIEATSKEIAALVLELQERPGVELEMSLDGCAITKAVLKAIRDRSADSTSPFD